MTYDSFCRPSSEKRGGRAKNIAAISALFAGAAVSGYIISDPGVPSDVIHIAAGQNPQEQKISDAIATATGKRFGVHCTNPVSWYDSSITGQSLNIVGVIPLPLIRLGEDICTNASRVDVLPQNPSDISEHHLDIAAEAVGTLIHEADHYIYHRSVRPRESEIECFAVQGVEGMATALGTSPAIAKRLAQRAMALSMSEQVPADYRLTADCVEGGPYDLHPQQPGDFPHPS